MHLPAFQAPHYLGAHIHGLHDLGTAPGHGHVLKELTHSVEQHDPHSLREITDGEGGQGGHAHEEVLVKHMALPQVPEGGPDDLPAQQHIGDDIARRGPKGRRSHVLRDLPRGKEDCSSRNDEDFLFVLPKNPLLLRLSGRLQLLPGGDCHLLLYGGADFPEFGQELLLMVRRHPELLCGKGDGGHLHPRQLPDLPLHPGRAVGASESLQNVDLLLYSGGYAVKFPACVVYLLMVVPVVVSVPMLMVMLVAIGLVFVMVLVAAAAGLVAVMMIMAVAAGLMYVVVTLSRFSFFSNHSVSSLHGYI